MWGLLGGGCGCPWGDGNVWGLDRGGLHNTLNIPNATKVPTLNRLMLRRDVNATSIIKKEKRS